MPTPKPIPQEQPLEKQQQEPITDPTQALSAFNQLTRSDAAIFSSNERYELAKKAAIDLSRATFIPKAFQQNPPNCLIIVDMCLRREIGPLELMQAMDVIQGQPVWKSQYIIGLLNTCGKFSSWRYVIKGEGMTRGCKIEAVLKTGGTVEGEEITMAMAKAEGWLDRNGSKWKTMPGHMMRLRAAAFFGREYIADLLFGLHTADEMADSTVIDVTPDKPPATGVAGAKEMLSG